MFMDDRTDTELLCAPDTRSFELFYRRHFEAVLGFFARRTRDAELSADLTAETFAAALAGRRRFRPDSGHGTRGCLPSRITSSPTRSGEARPRTAREGGWGWSGLSSP